MAIEVSLNARAYYELNIEYFEKWDNLYRFWRNSKTFHYWSTSSNEFNTKVAKLFHLLCSLLNLLISIFLATNKIDYIHRQSTIGRFGRINGFIGFIGFIGINHMIDRSFVDHHTRSWRDAQSNPRMDQTVSLSPKTDHMASRQLLFEFAVIIITCSHDSLSHLLLLTIAIWAPKKSHQNLLSAKKCPEDLMTLPITAAILEVNNLPSGFVQVFRASKITYRDVHKLIVIYDIHLSGLWFLLLDWWGLLCIETILIP